MVFMEGRNLTKSYTILIFESFLIVVVFNAGSYFGTTTYARSIVPVGIIMILSLIFWVFISSKLLWIYDRSDLGLQRRTVSRRQWEATALLVLTLYLAALVSESFYPTEFEGEITLNRIAVASSFTLTFGPLFEELLFRGYLFRRIDEVTYSRTLSTGRLEVSFASLFSGLLFGLWHLPTPIIVLHFKDPLLRTYSSLAGFVAAASLTGIVMGEIRRRTGSLLPGTLLHFCANSIYVLTMVSRLL